MESLNFPEVARLINRTGSTAISEKPIKEEAGQWALYEGLLQSGAISLKIYLLYLLSDANNVGFKSAKKTLAALPQPSSFQVVYAASLGDKYPTLKRTFADVTRNIVSLTEYFTSFLRQQIDNYLAKISTLPHQYYVDPYIKVPAGVSRKTPNPVLSLLIDDDFGPRPAEGAVGILLAEPGQGKTFMSRYLAVNAVRKKLIPIYVHSEQWSRMQPEELTSLWKTIVHSFRYFDAPIGWIEGAELDFVRVALKAGIFRIIFDGFDEYVLWNQGKVDALDTIQGLQKLSNETGARILVTSRTTFWESEIQEKHPDSGITPLVFTIEPFDQNHAQKYFSERFPNDKKKQAEAKRLFGILQQKTSTERGAFVGRGFFLYLIADLVRLGYSANAIQLDGLSVTEWIIDALCDREKTRQQLPINARKQLDIFQEFAVWRLSDEAPSSENLKLIIHSETSLTKQQVDELVGSPGVIPGKLKDHPLLSFDSASDEWYFGQNQVLFMLLAHRIISLSDRDSTREALRGLTQKQKFTPSLQADVANAIVDHLFEVNTAIDANNRIKRIVASLLACGTFSIGLGAVGNPNALACTLAVLANSKSFPHGSNHIEKTVALLALFPDKKLEHLCLSGTLARMDFRNISFENCHFEKVTWAACNFGSSGSRVGNLRG
jgi:hypothetical protein